MATLGTTFVGSWLALRGGDKPEQQGPPLNAKSKDRRGNEGIGGRYAVYDVEYDTAGEGKRCVTIHLICLAPSSHTDCCYRSKITFIAWVPDDASQYVSIPSAANPQIHTRLTGSLQPRMMYSSSKEAIKRALNGLAADIQANDPDDIEYESIVSRVAKGR